MTSSPFCGLATDRFENRDSYHKKAERTNKFGNLLDHMILTSFLHISVVYDLID